MVRTKADAATRVAAGGKAPKKMANHSAANLWNSGEKVGKDNLPVNRYFPRETPTWQKKITCFIKSESGSSSKADVEEEKKENKSEHDESNTTNNEGKSDPVMEVDGIADEESENESMDAE